MGADWVIAIDLNSDLLGRHIKRKPARPPRSKTPQESETITDSVTAHIRSGMSQLGIRQRDTADKPPAMRDVLATTINIMQVLITRSRLAGEPADVMITPHLAELGLMEFHRAATAIEAGQRAAEQTLPQLMALLNHSADA